MEINVLAFVTGIVGAGLMLGLRELILRVGRRPVATTRRITNREVELSSHKRNELQAHVQFPKDNSKPNKEEAPDLRDSKLSASSRD
jgi:hypothetical protein